MMYTGTQNRFFLNWFHIFITNYTFSIHRIINLKSVVCLHSGLKVLSSVKIYIETI